MKTTFHRKLKTILLVTACGATLAGAPIAFGQVTTDTPSRTADAIEDRSPGWGWLGLIGLFGLMGLKRRHTHDEYRTTSAPKHA